MIVASSLLSLAVVTALEVSAPSTVVGLGIEFTHDRLRLPLDNCRGDHTGVAMLTMLLTFAIGVLGRPERNYTVALFGCLALIWAGAILVIVLIKLQI